MQTEVTEESKTSHGVIHFDFDQYRKLLIAKSVCIDHEIVRRVFTNGIDHGYHPFLNVILMSPSDEEKEKFILHQTQSMFPHIKEMYIRWNQQFPSFSTYMVNPCDGWKFMDIDIEDTTYCNQEQLDFFMEFVQLLNVCNTLNKTIDRRKLKPCFGVIRDIGDAVSDILSTQLEIDMRRINFTGRGFQVWAKYEDERVYALMQNGYLCKSNDPHRKAQRLYSPLFMGIEKTDLMKAHMQCCVPFYNWNLFKFSNPAFFMLTDANLRSLAMEYNKTLLISQMRSGGKDLIRWFDEMEAQQMELEKKIIELLKIDRCQP